MFSINNEEWDLRFVSPYSSILMNPDGSYTLGVTVPEHRTIYLSNELSGEMLDHVLSHELFHAEMVSRNIYIPIYIEEALCDLVADHYLETINIANNVHKNLCRYYGKC